MISEQYLPIGDDRSVDWKLPTDCYSLGTSLQAPPHFGTSPMLNRTSNNKQSIRSFFVSMFITVALASPVSAKDLAVVEPQKEGISQDRLDKLTTHMNQAVVDGVMVGGLGMIARNGKIVYSETYGQSNREANKAMTDDAIFRIYSMSKPITSVALMMLYEEGHFFLNDPVAKYIPELANLKVAVSTADGNTSMISDGTQSRTIGSGDNSKTGQTRKPTRQPTIRDLMRHTAGLTYGVFGNTEVDQQYRKAGILGNKDLEEFVTALGQIPLQYDPGSKWHYSVSVDVQGRLIEAISGMSFGDFLKQRLFMPLGMEDTSFVVPSNKLDRFAQIYSPEGTGEGLAAFLAVSSSAKLVPSGDRIDAGFLEGATFEGGGGGMVSTAKDYLIFSQMMLNGGELNGVRILSPKTVELMTTNHLGDMPMGFGRSGVGFGLGFAVALDQGEIGELGSAGTYNWGGAAGTQFWIDPVEQLIGIFMVQSIPHKTRLGSEFKILTYQSIIK
ncbi:Beta-lactamase [marine gamma proteobacterium HTCC2143]|uniref:Beta-lactamase n=1 Tax=marine gamma proteobacterium HTCC2143 TaxID=247633 RepID=A0YE25_9GAMM|nr:Beta-lactamase [marine gamma proteobacterium HTCC2143]